MLPFTGHHHGEPTTVMGCSETGDLTPQKTLDNQNKKKDVRTNTIPQTHRDVWFLVSVFTFDYTEL